MSMHSQNQIPDEYDLSAGPGTASEHFKERELARRSHLLLTETRSGSTAIATSLSQARVNPNAWKKVKIATARQRPSAPNGSHRTLVAAT